MIYTNDEIINAVKILHTVCEEYSQCVECPLFSDVIKGCAFERSPKYVEPVTNQRYWRAVK